ncbi:MAG: aminotransferase class IV [Candidatus Moraniibacteriota bacterium]
MKDNFCYFNGAIIKFDKIKISPFDLGFVRGYGIFDAMRTSNGIPFCLEEHWDKFQKSAHFLDLKIPLDKEEFEKIIQFLLKKNNFKEMAIKTILTGGESKNGFIRGGAETFLILADNLDNYILDEKIYQKGVKVIKKEYERPCPEIKNLNYLFPLNIQKEKNQSGAMEIVYVNQGKILECSTSNIFMVKNKTIVAPKKGVFSGTLRNLVIRLAKENNLSVEERDIKKDEFKKADEIFLTATYKKIVPVVKVDEEKVADGRVGEITKKLMFLLDDFISNYGKKYGKSL